MSDSASDSKTLARRCTRRFPEHGALRFERGDRQVFGLAIAHAFGWNRPRRPKMRALDQLNRVNITAVAEAMVST